MLTRHLVEPLEARIAPASIFVLNTADSGQGSLRAAIERANTTPEADMITFRLGNPGQNTIELQDALPVLGSQITINGAQAGFAASAGALIRLVAPEGLLISGLTLGGSDNEVIGLGFLDFAKAGVEITGNNNAVEACYFDGNATGILITGDHNVIGGGAWQNEIMRSSVAGVAVRGTIDDPATGNLIRHNQIESSSAIGIDAVNASELMIGAPGRFYAGNTIRYQSNFAIHLAGPATHDVQIDGNIIQANATAFNILIEGGAHDVRISQNKLQLGQGIRVVDGYGVSATDNYSSQLLDLGTAGPDANDPLDADTGANGLLNHPVITSMAREFGQARVAGVYDGAPNLTLRLVFSDPEGAAGEILVTTDANGHAEFDVLVTPRRAELPIRVAAIDAGGSSSEFSNFIFPTDSTPVKTRITGVSSLERDAAVAASFTVELSRPSTSTVTMTVSPTGLTATLGEDFQFTATTITFQPGETSKPVQVVIQGDDLLEPIETYRLDLSNPVNAVIDPGFASALGFIRDDDHSYTIATNQRSVTWTDVDGDLVTLSSSKAIFQPGQFTFLSAGVGEQLAALKLTEFSQDQASQNFDLIFSVRKVKGNLEGDGRVDVGYIDATGVDLRKVTLPGDLGRIDAGLLDPGFSVAKLTLGSLGTLGTTTQVPAELGVEAPTLASRFKSSVGTFTVKGDVAGAAVTFGNSSNSPSLPATNVSIAGDLIGAAQDWSGSFQSQGEFRTFVVKGDVIAGSGAWSGAINAEGGIVSVTIGKSLLGLATSPAIGAGSVSAGGDLGKVKIGVNLQGGFGDRSGSIFTTGEGDIGSVTIGGTLSGRSHDLDGDPIFNGISSAGRLGKVSVGSIAGTAAEDRVGIFAAGQALMRTAADSVAIAGLTVKGSVANLELLAGFDLRGEGVNPHAAIGAIKIGGDFATSRILAGVTPEDGAVEAATGFRHLTSATARIASIVIKGSVSGTDPAVSATDLFGAFSAEIGAFMADGERLALKANKPGTPLDAFLVGASGDFAVRELA